MTRRGREKTNERYHRNRYLERYAGHILALKTEAQTICQQQDGLESAHSLGERGGGVFGRVRGDHCPAGYAQHAREEGVYHRLLETSLAAHDFPFARVNPRQARRFAEGTGKLAKTDRVDAAMLARMGSLLELKADQPKSETQHDLKQLATARQALIKDRTAARARLQTATHPLLKKQFALRLRQIERDLAQINATTEATVAADKDLAARAEILTSIPGIARITAFALLTDMPELGRLSGKQAASLAGLAPISRQSGKWQGKERIQGGRASLRKAIYLPAVVATRFNPDMKAKYHELIAKGKCKKLAITAVMRKLVVMANALLRDGRKWTEMRP